MAWSFSWRVEAAAAMGALAGEEKAELRAAKGEATREKAPGSAPNFGVAGDVVRAEVGAWGEAAAGARGGVALPVVAGAEFRGGGTDVEAEVAPAGAQ